MNTKLNDNLTALIHILKDVMLVKLMLDYNLDDSEADENAVTYNLLSNAALALSKMIVLQSIDRIHVYNDLLTNIHSTARLIVKYSWNELLEHHSNEIESYQ